MCKCVESNKSLCKHFFIEFNLLVYRCTVTSLINRRDKINFRVPSFRDLTVSALHFRLSFHRSTECVSVGINYLFHMLFNLIDMLIIVYNKKSRDEKNQLNTNKNIKQFD